MTAKRYNEGKPQLTRVLEFGSVLDGVARIMENGDAKYGRGNWREGLPPTQVADSLLRHLRAFLNGEDRDPESGLHHADHVVVNAMMLAWSVREHPELDDRVT